MSCDGFMVWWNCHFYIICKFADLELSLPLVLCINVRVRIMSPIVKQKKIQKTAFRVLAIAMPKFNDLTSKKVMTQGLGMCSVFLFTALNTSAQQEKSLIQKEIQSRAESVTLAQELLRQGDVAYNSAKFGEAVEVYQKAFELIPVGELTFEIKAAAAQRYAQAVVENAKALSRFGQYDVARSQLNSVLEPGVSPKNAAVIEMLAKLDDPIRTSPTLTPELVNDIQNVSRWLRKGESFFNEGNFDKSMETYDEALKIDPYNKAARRGIEKVSIAATDYAHTSGDERRAAALAQVSELWERKVQPEGNIQIAEFASGDGELVGLAQTYKSNKLKTTIVPTVNFKEMNFEQALRMVRMWARELDTTELDPNKKGLNFVTRFGDREAGFLPKIEAARFNLQLSNVPLATVLDYVTQATGTYWRVEQYAVVIRPVGAYTAELSTRTFRVPPGFMSDSGKEQASDDVFASPQSGIQTKTSPIDYFKALGIDFPKGTSAFYTKTNNTLKVTNTPRALDSIDAFVRNQSLKENVQVVITTTIIDTSQDNLEELGFDWLLDPVAFNNNRTSISGGTRGNGDLIVPIGEAGPTTTFNGSPVTSGNSSGSSMFSADSIDARIAGLVITDPNARASELRAPGILQVTGVTDGSSIQAILRGLDNKKDNTELHVPSVVIALGHRASVRSSREMLYPTEYEPGEIVARGSVPSLPSNPTAFDVRELGVRMEYEPTVSDDRLYIDLNVAPEIVEFEGFVNYGSPIQQAAIDPLTGLVIPLVTNRNEILQPIFRVLRINTNVTIRDGHTMVIGGLIEQKIESVNDKIPILGDLPLLGRFFQSDGIRSSRRAIIIFVKAELVDPTGRPWRNR